MELTNAAVRDRIADLNALAAELRIEREARPAPSGPSRDARAAVHPGRRLGDWLIGLGTSLGGDPAAFRRNAVR